MNRALALVLLITYIYTLGSPHHRPIILKQHLLRTVNNAVNVANKACRVLFYLKRTFVVLPPAFSPLYNIFIRYHLEYAINDFPL